MAKKIIETKYLSQEEISILAKCTRNIFFFSQYIWVVNPVKGKVPFSLYPFQKSVLYEFLRNRFNIILKFRQAGITELISMYCLWLAMYHPNKTINIISIKDTVAKKVLKKIKFMYKNLPWYLRTPLVGTRSGDLGTVTTMTFINGSVIESIPTSDQAGRSESLSLLVIDEAAVVRWASTIWASSFPTLSCISGSYKLGIGKLDKKTNKVNINSVELVPIKDICPNSFGQEDISDRGLYTLTHNGDWEKITHSLNKGELETWEILDNRGYKLEATPAHKLLTPNGWASIKEILDKDLSIIQAETLNGFNPERVITKPPKKIIRKFAFSLGKHSYFVTNLGEVFRGDNTKVRIRIHKGKPTITLHTKKQTKNLKVSRLVAEAFIGPISEGKIVDHINNNPLDNYVTNLQIISPSNNIKRSYKNNLNSLNTLINIDICKYGRVMQLLEKNPNLSHKDISSLYTKLYNEPILRKTIGNISNQKKVYLSKLKLKRKFITTIYDIQVENSHSYILPEVNFINHNTGGQAIINSTPFGVGNFYHSMWVDATSGSMPINPIRLHWQMHPERDDSWYETMSKVLGPKRTAQEIDGDFLSSGSTVFDLADIKAVEYQLSDYPILKRRLKGQYLEFNEPDENTQYYIGADCATGRSTDYSAFSCMNQEGEEVVVYKGKLPLNKYAQLLGDTGQRFNYALLAPETNDIGMAVTMALQDEGYPNLYHSKKLLRKKGKSRSEEELIPGWLTTTKNRSLIIEGLEKDLREDNITIKDPFFISEAYTFIYDSTGRPVAMGKHKVNSSVDIDLDGETYSDDAIFGKAITNHIRKYGNLNHTVVMPK